MYCKVKAQCGHVGRTKYIEKTFYLIASDRKEAAKLVRAYPRVLHDAKNAILSVDEIGYEEYILGKRLNNEDIYLHVHSKQDQKLYNAVSVYELIDRYQDTEQKSKCTQYKRKKNKNIEKCYDDEINYYIQFC